MKAHQNRNMTYDEMYDYGMFNGRRTLREATYCHYIIINMILTDFTVQMLNEHNVSVQIILQIVLAIHGLFPLLEGRHLTNHASSDEAHGAVDSASGSLRHQ